MYSCFERYLWTERPVCSGDAAGHGSSEKQKMISMFGGDTKYLDVFTVTPTDMLRSVEPTIKFVKYIPYGILNPSNHCYLKSVLNITHFSVAELLFWFG